MSDNKSRLNDWFLSLPEERRIALLNGDRWMLADAAFEAGIATHAGAAAAEPIYQISGAFADDPKCTWRDASKSDYDMHVASKRRILYATPLTSAPAVPEASKEAAVIEAAREWSSERVPDDWAEADLMKAVVRLDGDWAGCDECDHDCDEPCMPYTVEESIAHIDARLAELVREGKLYAPQEWKPISGPQTLNAKGVQPGERGERE